jgi:SNF2 family DNA or RNA helicase
MASGILVTHHNHHARSYPTTMSIFADILKEATAAATGEAIEQAAVEGFAARSALTEPTDGFTLPLPADGFDYYGYQAAAVQTIIEFRRAIVGYAPGMGKTRIAIASARHHVREEGGKVIVICPPSLRLDPWEREFQGQFPDLRIVSVKGTKARNVEDQYGNVTITEVAPIADADVLLVPDSVVLSKRALDIIEWGPTALVVDEVQRFKSPRAGRTRALHRIADTITDGSPVKYVPVDPTAAPSLTALLDERPLQGPTKCGMVIPLSGTLSKNSPDDVWSPVRALGKRHAINLSGGESFQVFQQKWCLTETVRARETDKYGVTRSGNIQKTTGLRDDDLHSALRACAYIRVERNDVLNMPEKMWIDRSLELTDAEMKEYRKMEANFLLWVKEQMGDAALARAERAEALVRLMKLWETAGVAKAKAVAEYVDSLVEQGEKVVIMGWHKLTIATLQAELDKLKLRHVSVVGGMSAKQKLDAQDQFRDTSRYGADVLIGNITAAGTGLNLEVACHLVFAQTCWSPGDVVQTSDRIYRVTQQNDCVVHVLNAAETVDEHVWGVLKDKAQVVDLVNSGGAETTIDTGDVQRLVLEAYGWFE